MRKAGFRHNVRDTHLGYAALAKQSCGYLHDPLAVLPCLRLRHPAHGFKTPPWLGPAQTAFGCPALASQQGTRVARLVLIKNMAA
jgi:hypothetical protein